MARPTSQFEPLALGALACRLLAPEAGALQAPVRSVIFGSARFSEHGRSLARAHEVTGPHERRGSFFPRLRENLQMLRDARALLEDHARQGHHLAPAAGWLIDHGTLLERQLETVKRSLPRSYFNKLPRLRGEPLAGLPRIYGLAWAWVAHTDSGLDEDLLELFLSAYQSQRELTLAELWAIPTTLRVVLVENLRRLAERAATRQAAQDAAHRWVERTPAAGDVQRLAQIGHALQQRGVLEAFALQLQRRSDEFSADVGADVRSWLATHLTDAAGALQRQQQQQAEDHQSVRNAVTALRGLDRVDWRGVLLRSSAALADLQRLPVFAAESEATQDLTLHEIEALARQAQVPESEVSAMLARLAGAPPKHAPGSPRAAPGARPAPFVHPIDPASVPALPASAAPLHWLRGPGRPVLVGALALPDRWARLKRGVRRVATPAYLCTLATATVVLVAWVLQHGAASGLPPWTLAVTALLLAGPASEAVLAVVHRLLSEGLPPAYLPRLAFEDGIPAGQRPLVVMPVMLTSAAGVQALAAQLEQHYLANPERHAQFALLSDCADAPQRQMPTDAPLQTAACSAIEQLNARYPGSPGAPLRFLLLHRERVWSDSEQAWMGWERKRGKLEQLLGWLVTLGPPGPATLPSAPPGAPAFTSPFIDLGALSSPASGVRSVVTLDSDTDMPPGRLRELAAIHAHPMNAPVLDAPARRVSSGYAILQPRVVVPLPRAGTVTPFHWLFSGQWGVDPYSVTSSEIYQDLFREGTFTGKGLLDVHAVHTLLAQRLPAEQVLSHDLLEGALARCAAVSDVTLVEDAPAHPDVADSRLHRWLRGDWQLLPFIVQPRRWPMAAINRWKMVDNLRRSLVAPASLALLLWVLASGALPLASALWLVAAAYGAGPLLGALAALAPPRDDIALGLFFQRAGTELLRALGGALWHALQLLAHARLSVDAIGRALWRQARSRRRLLQWTTAAAAQAAARTDLPSLWRRHRGVSLVAAGLLLALLGLRVFSARAGWPVPPLDDVLALSLLWAATPLWAYLASLRVAAASQRIDPDARGHLRALARDTWAYYSRYVGPEDHHLPPDNVQFTGAQPMVAHRTSPTNIGLYLLGVAAAREMGFIGAAEMAQRLEHTLDTLDRLPRWHGHFYNWTDTQTLSTLPPAYVSTVDSGNLSGHLLVLSSACESLATAPDEVEAGLAARLHRLAERARTLALAADFSPLYDTRRRLLHIGNDVDSERLDTSHYDLLASEARLASLVAIAKGDIPPSHWAVLARPLFATPGGRHGYSVGLRSWSGSMFEYLMPSLVIEEPPGSLLYQATRTAVAVQRQDAAERGTPWGVSECGIAVQDHTLAYQYGPQGVASLALRRTPADERVIAPYASALALLVAPRAAVDNLAALEALGARRDLGFIEALDYTPYRQPAEAPGRGTPDTAPSDGQHAAVHAAAGFTPVHTFMAHHQGMSLLACAHVLTDGAPHRWAARQPHLRAVQPLLHERAPHLAALMRERPAPPMPTPLQGQRWQFESRPRRSALPATHLLGNDRYAVALRANGAGFSQWQGLSLTRWRDDALCDAHGVFGYIMRPQAGHDRRWQPLAAHPAAHATAFPADPTASATATEPAAGRAEYSAEFHPDRALLHARFADLAVTTTVSVSTLDDCELRRVQLHNPGRRPLRVVLAMAFEPTLTAQRADEAHPAFSNLFLQAHWSAADRALFLQRRPRLMHEQTLHAVHCLAACDDPHARVQVLADRTRWLGRLGNVAQPLPDAWSDPGGVSGVGGVSGDVGDGHFPRIKGVPPGQGDEASIALDTGLDPVAVLMIELTVPPHGSRSLTFVIGAAFDEDALHALVDRYQQPAIAERALGLSDTLARIRLRELRLDLETWVAWLHLNTLLVGAVTRPALGALGGEALAHEAIDRRGLWRHGIGGERPMLALWIESAEGLGLARQLVSMLNLWTAAGQALDLVVINAELASYDAPVQRAFVALAELAALRVDPQLPAERRAALKLLNARDLLPAERATLRMLARVSLPADGRSLAQQIERARAVHEADRAERHRCTRLALTVARPHPRASAPVGSFDAADADFRFELGATHYPLRPWINVLANPDFGTQVSESGAGFTWAGNSRQHQITAGANDALCDLPSEALWLHDLDRGRVWWLGRGPGTARREVVHGIGHTRMRQFIDGLDIELAWCVDAQAAVKQLRVSISQPGNTGVGSAGRRLRLVGFAEWTMGAARTDRATVVTQARRWTAVPQRHAAEPAVGLALLATQRDASAGHGGATAFLCWRASTDVTPGQAGSPAAAIDLDDWTCDRREFFDDDGRWVLPERLNARAGAGLDACAAVSCLLELRAGRAAQATLLMGHADHPDAAVRLARDACGVMPTDRLAKQLALWPALLDAVRVQTPDPLFDALVNRWLPYQAIACRLWARAGFYQAGGAFGFRDQLQDAMNLADRAPQLLVEQLRVHAARQFEQGDVQHWWHPPGGAGVRTRMTDDLLWLPLALAHGVRHSGSAALLDELVPFLHGAPVPPEREDLYETPTPSEESASLFEHGARAIDHSLATLDQGRHGLPLMGTGDWNDGMNRVGFEGRGESVWLAWFLCRVIDDYLPLAEARALRPPPADPAGLAAPAVTTAGTRPLAERVAHWRSARTRLAVALEDAGWDGAWYRRAFFDDGTPLGSSTNDECRIDLIAQAWAVLSGSGDPAHAAQAMDSARTLLWDPQARLMRLLHPPLVHAQPDAGYIQAYPPGIRENGGQYNHGAVWALMASAQQGDAAWAWRLFEALSPAHRSADPVLGPVYALEPYVMAGDIYSQPPWTGRGGWSWYTGAASWVQRAALESICGLHLAGSVLTLKPCVPPQWARVDLQLQRCGRSHRITLLRDEAALRAEMAPQPPQAPSALQLRRGQALDLERVAPGCTLVLLLEERDMGRGEDGRQAQAGAHGENLQQLDRGEPGGLGMGPTQTTQTTRPTQTTRR